MVVVGSFTNLIVFAKNHLLGLKLAGQCLGIGEEFYVYESGLKILHICYYDDCVAYH